MPQFNYKGRNNHGALVRGQIEAVSANAVAEQLFNSGVTPIDIATGKNIKKNDKKLTDSFRLNKVSLDDLILFTRQMRVLMQAGIPIIRCFTSLIQATHNPRLIAAQKDILTKIESGRDLSSSMASHAHIFSDLFINMIKVGENTGKLNETLLQLEKYLTQEKETRERIKTALRYPIFAFAAVVAAIFAINIWVIPSFSGLFSQLGTELPWQTELLLTTSAFFLNWWPMILIFFLANIIAFQVYVRTEQGKYKWDQIKLKFPLAGNIIHRATLARFARAFAISLTSGVPLTRALTVVSKSIGNQYIGDDIVSLRNAVERGETLVKAAALINIFPPLVLQMLAIGEETGNIDEMMKEVAGYYEQEVNYDIKGLSSAIEPILIICISIMVLILALGVFLPMWDLTGIAK